jgi:hypothetical protein
MTYRKAAEKQGFPSSADDPPGTPDFDAPSTSRTAADDSDNDCQPCSESDGGVSIDVDIDVDIGLDTIGEGLCLPDASLLSLPALSGLLAGGDRAGDHYMTGSTGANGPAGCEDSAGGGQASAGAQADISIGVGLNLGDPSAALSSLLSSTPLLGDAAQFDGLLGGVIASDCAAADSRPGASLDPGPLSTIDGALEASTDASHLLDGGDCTV